MNSDKLLEAAQELLARVRLLAEQDRDDHGRFSGPGGGGGGKIASGSPGSGKHEDAAHDESVKASKASKKAKDAASHNRAAEAHQRAADAHGQITGSGIAFCRAQIP